MDKELFKPEVNYIPAIELALNAKVGPPISIEEIWYDEDDEVFLLHIREENGMLYEDPLEARFVFSCYKAVQKGITKWHDT